MNGEWGMGNGEWEKKKLFIIRCVRTTQALRSLCLDASLAKMLVCTMERGKERVASQEFYSSSNDFYFRRYNYSIIVANITLIFKLGHLSQEVNI
jgi:hypothetical protein